VEQKHNVLYSNNPSFRYIMLRLHCCFFLSQKKKCIIGLIWFRKQLG